MDQRPKNEGLVTQFPDLTEIKYTSVVTQEDIREVKTEFMFFLKAPHSSGIPAEGLGLKPVSMMNNWWPSHNGENRALTLYWARVPHSEGIPQLAERKRWEYSSTEAYADIEQHLAASGCGLKIGEPPLEVALFHRFFTLMRMPVEVKLIQKRWLTKHNYRLLDTGKLASYWVNGWSPEEYSHAKEYAYFGTSQKEWREKGMDGYR